MGKYDAFAATALSLIGRKGADLIVTRNASSFDPITEVETVAPGNTATFKAVGLPPGRSAVDRVGSLVDRNIIEFHIARLGVAMEPQPGDVAIWGGQSWTLIEQTSYDPAADGPIYTRALAER